ncbi:hypothetical protein BLA29_014734 [Euroglyphus maynei]|uniref:Uncharacterized protein n=1 Tax=Euroglyphus maynei TaxID=6958 RepID=A0A1Y3B307_EURMA|nr:hypothetical protein BLA29_014734 [Euroglyphus maynei]
MNQTNWQRHRFKFYKFTSNKRIDFFFILKFDFVLNFIPFFSLLKIYNYPNMRLRRNRYRTLEDALFDTRIPSRTEDEFRMGITFIVKVRTR